MVKVALAQIDTTVGDISGNAAKVEAWTARAAERGADLVVFPELCLNGYPPRDLVDVPEFVAAGEAAVRELAGRLSGGPAALVGFVASHAETEGLGRYNAAAWLEGGEVRQVAHKTLLPNYDVFDEHRHFDEAQERCWVEHQGQRLGLSICEDLWNDREFWSRRRYTVDPMEELARAGASWVLNLSASPFHLGKPRLRREMLQASARRHGVGLLLCNLVGGNDSLVFDGNSLVLGPDGAVLAAGRAFEEDLVVVDLEGVAPVPIADRAPVQELEDALVLGLRDYVEKTGFRTAVLGVSGGIDSAVTAALAVRALGPERVTGVAMPSRYTSDMSDEDAAVLAGNLGMKLEVIPIEGVVREFSRSLGAVFEGRPPDVTEENLQARARGVLLMALSNKLGHLLLTTGNKSELAVGYCTLYGDMCGGFNVIGDVEKTLVYELARWLNRDGPCIPERIITRPPSAELRPDQKDEDSLPPYSKLDSLLHDLVVEHRTTEELETRGHDPLHVRDVRALLIRSEYKRRQAAPCLKVTARAFGEGWRFPIAHRWRWDS